MVRLGSKVLFACAVLIALLVESPCRAQQQNSSQETRVLLLLKRSDQQEAAIKKLLGDLQDPRSASYHRWLKPDELGTRFGASDAQVSRLRTSLAARGLTLSKVYANRFAFEVSGTAAQLHQVFPSSEQTPGGKTGTSRIIPAELADLIESVAIGGAPQAAAIRASDVAYDRKQHAFFHRTADAPAVQNTSSQGAQPQVTVADFGPVFYGVTPGDIAIQYGLPTYVQGPNTEINGYGSTVGVVSDYNVNLNYLQNYGNTFGFYMPTIQVIVDGQDPGVTGGPIDTYFEVEAIGAIAPDTVIDIYTAANDGNDSGYFLSLNRAISDNVVNVLLFPYQACEANAGANNSSFSIFFEAAAAQGITVVTPAGDIGSAACDQQFGSAASSGLAVNGVASTPHATAVGGTDFYYGAQGAATSATYEQYWSDSTTAYTQQLAYVPEQAWNDSNQATDQNAGYPYLLAGGGGVSTLGLTNASDTTQAPYPQPWWQMGVVPASITQTARTIPDVSFFAGDYTNNSTYIFCATGADCANGTNQDASNLVFTSGSGTEVSGAIFAGIMALVVGEHGPQGNVNPTLYSMSKSTDGVFNDVVYGTNSVMCTAGTPNCSNGLLVDQNGNPAYSASAGYDAATGLGSINATALVQQWTPPNTSPTTTTIAVLNPTTGKPITSFQQGTPVNIVTTVTGSGGTPTGDVAIVTDAPQDSSDLLTVLTLSSGTATDANDILLPGGTYHIYARFGGDATYQASMSAGTALTVSAVPCTVVVFTQSLQSGASITYGTPVSITMEPFETGNSQDVLNATGYLTVKDNGKSLTTVPLDSDGAGIFTSANFLPGSHQLSFAYSGDQSFQSCSLSSNLSFTVTASPTSTALSSSLSIVPSTNGSYTLTAVVTPTGTIDQGAFPSGTVTFKRGDGTTLASNINLQGFYANGQPAGESVAYLGAGDLLPGNNSITATFVPKASTGYATSTSGNVAVTLGASSGLTSSDLVISTADGGNTYFDYMSTVTLNASVSGNGTPTGTVALYINGTFLANMTSLGAGQWTYVLDSSTTPTGLLPLDIGHNTIVAQYSGDSANSADWANLELTVLDDQVHPDYTITSPVDYKIITHGTTTVSFPIILSSINGFGGTIYFNPTGPGAVTCSIANPGSVNLNAQQTVTTTLTCSNLPTTTGRLYVNVASNSGIPSTTPNISTGIAHELPLRIIVK